MTRKKKGAKIGRPKKPDGVQIPRSIGFPPKLYNALDKLHQLTGKSFAKIVQEGGDLIVEVYRKKGHDV